MAGLKLEHIAGLKLKHFCLVERNVADHLQPKWLTFSRPDLWPFNLQNAAARDRGTVRSGNIFVILAANRTILRDAPTNRQTRTSRAHLAGETQTMTNPVLWQSWMHGGLFRLHYTDEDAGSWLTNYGPWHAYDKERRKKEVVTGQWPEITEQCSLLAACTIKRRSHRTHYRGVDNHNLNQPQVYSFSTHTMFKIQKHS